MGTTAGRHSPDYYELRSHCLANRELQEEKEERKHMGKATKGSWEIVPILEYLDNASRYRGTGRVG